MLNYYKTDTSGVIVEVMSFNDPVPVYDENNEIVSYQDDVNDYIKSNYLCTDKEIVQLVDGTFAFADEVDFDAEAKRKAEKEFAKAKQAKLTEVDQWTATKITGGFVSNCYNGENILYDTDQDTQLTMTIAKSLCESERFAEELPNGMECRGYEQVGTDTDGTMVFSKDKTIYYFSPEQVKGWIEDFGLHLRECKKQGWIKQAQVNACTTKEELEAVVLE